MAVAYESVATATSTTIPKPTGLAVGDYMVAHLSGSHDAGQAIDNYTKTGWTLITGSLAQSGSNTNRGTALYKIADSSDVAASNFVFTADADANTTAGAIYRFSGVGALSGTADADITSTTSHTFTNTLTPTFENSLMLFLASCANGGGTSFSTYAITTDNPTWTERVDTSNTAGTTDDDTTIAGATASRPEVTATGNATVTSADAVTSTNGLLIALYPQLDASVSGSVGSLTLNGNVGSVVGSASVSGSVGSLTLNGNVGTPTQLEADWKTLDKSETNPTTTNTPKS